MQATMEKPQDEALFPSEIEATAELILEPEGRDEMNLSEYPIALLADRAPKDVKTLVYKDRDETLTVTGSDHLGLPTAPDIDVIIALLYLTKKKNNFTNRVVNFTRYELMEVLRWHHGGHYYDRLEKSLDRWTGVTLIYKRAWWDNDKKSKGNLTFHILDAVKVVEKGEIQSRKGGGHQLDMPFSWIRWSEEFFASFKANNLKKLDLDVYFSLNSSISKQLYRFLDKRFYKRAEWTFDLRTLACEHVGLSRNYPSWKIKQKLQPALEELVGVEFLEEMPDEERYSPVCRGEWKITLRRNKALKPRKAAGEVFEVDDQLDGESPLESELVDRGVSSKIAKQLVAEYPEELILRQIEYFDFRRAEGKTKFTEPGGYLAKGIREDYAQPQNFQSRVEREEKERQERAEIAREAAAKREKLRRNQREKEIQAKVKAYCDALTTEELEVLDEEAIKEADPEVLRSYRDNLKPSNKNIAQMMLRKSIREPYVKRLLGLEPSC